MYMMVKYIHRSRMDGTDRRRADGFEVVSTAGVDRKMAKHYDSVHIY